MTKCRVIFMGTPDFAVPCLSMLVEENYEVAAVVTQPDRPKGRGQKLAFSPVKEAALAYNIPVLQPEKIKTPEFEQKLAKLAPDLIVVVAFGQLLSKTILALPPLGCINVHASLLPKYRGAAPIHWAIINNEIVSGVTTMYMDIGMDTGDIILAAQTSIGANETTGELHDKLRDMGAELLKKTVALLVCHKAPRTPQQHEAATYAVLLKKEIEKINWSLSALEIHNLVRGLNPWPGAYAQHHNLLKIWQTKVLSLKEVYSQPGRIAGISKEGIIVETGQGRLELLLVQPASKRRISALEYAHGYNIAEGEILK
ncbi:MAG: methionyl-tRNA formyltransferase [Pelosinus sp.]|nr:methionyl-tRNA formyltransferase [Pelosinus sp.]